MPYTYSRNNYETLAHYSLIHLRPLRTNTHGLSLSVKVDTIDLQRLLDLGSWTPSKQINIHGNDQYYAIANNRAYPDSPLPKTLTMHRIINDTPAHRRTFHKNGDTLDNRRSNLTLTDKGHHWRPLEGPSRETLQRDLITAQREIAQLREQLTAERAFRVPSNPPTRRATKQQWIREFKLSQGCAACGYADNPDLLHCHHTDPATKVDDISRLTRGSWGTLLQELSKCIILCKPCHNKIHPYGPY